MIKNIIFIIMLGLSINQSLYSMEITDQEEPESLDLFVVQAEGYKLLFRKVNISSLKSGGSNRQKFLQLFEHEAEISNFFKYTIGVPSETLFIPNAETVLNFYVRHYEKILEEKGPESVIHWVIEDWGNDRAFVGQVCLHTYVNKRLEKCIDRCLALNITINIPYRNKKLFTSLAQSTLNKLMSHKNFANATFCFEVNPHDSVIKKAVKKINATKVLSWTMGFQLEDTTDPTRNQTFTWSKDLFIILPQNT